MKFKTTLITLLCVGTITGASAATNTSTTSSNWYDQLRESPHGMLIYSQNVMTRHNDTSKVRDITSNNYIYNSYKFNKDYKLTLENLVQRENPRFGEARNNHIRTTLTFKRYNILTQDKNGTNLTASIDYRYFPEFDYRRANNITSHVRGIVGQSVTYGRLTLDNSLLLYNYFNRDSSKADAQTTKWYFDLIQSLSVTDKLSFYLEEEIIFGNTNKGVAEKSDFYLTAAASYTFNKIISAEFAIDSKLMAGHDGRTIRKDFGRFKDLGYTATAVISLF